MFTQFFFDLVLAVVGMVLGAVIGFFGCVTLLSPEMHPAVTVGLALLSALFGAGVFGIIGANLRKWLRGAANSNER